MALKKSKRISELTALTSASLQTTLVGVDNGTTYKVTLDVLEDAIINMVSRSTDLRLDSLEAYTASANAASDLSPLNSFTSSQNTLNSAFTNGINARLQTSSFNDFSASVHSEILAATNEQSLSNLVTTSSFNSYTASISTGSLVNSITNLNNATSSYETKGRGIWSGSAQLPSGVVSGSSQVLGGSGVVSGSYETTGRSIISSSAQITAFGFISSSQTVNTGSLITTSSFNSYTASISTASLVTSITNLNTFTASQSTSSLVNRLNAIESVSGSWITESETGSFLISLNGAISSSSQLTSSYDTRYTLSGSVGATPSGTISSSAQITSFGFISASGAIPDGTISGSAQITAFGFISSSTTINTGSFAITGSNTFSGSQIITGSLTVTNGITGSIRATNGVVSGSSQVLGGSGVYSGSLYAAGARFSFQDVLLGVGTTLGIISSDGGKPIYFRPNGISSNTTAVFWPLGGLAIKYAAGALTQAVGLALDVSGSVGINGFTNITGSLLVTQGISGSIAATNGVISGSSQLTSLNSFTGSVLLTSSFNSYTASISTASLVTSITNLNTATESLNISVNALNTATSSYETIGRNIVSGSSQLTSSFDERYALSASILNINTGSFATTGSNYFYGNQTISGSVNLDYIIFSSQSAATLQNYMLQANTTDKTLDLKMGNNATLQLGQEMYFPPIVNKSGVDLNDGDLVMVNPAGIAQGNRISVVKAISDGTYPADKIVGILTEDVANNAEGFATWFGYVRNISKTHIQPAGETWTEGDILYPNPAIPGKLTNVFPTAPNLKVTVATITSINGNNVTILVNFHKRTALKRAHDVLDNSTTSSYGDLLIKSGSVWTNRTTTEIGIVTTGSFNAFTASAATTGSNIFNGNQAISGSLSTTGSLTTKGNVTIGTGSGAEGGQIDLGTAQTGNTSLTGSTISLDVYGDKVRIFESSGNNRGAYLNVASQSNSVGSSIITSPNLLTMQTITSASYAALTPVSGTLYIIIG